MPCNDKVLVKKAFYILNYNLYYFEISRISSFGERNQYTKIKLTLSLSIICILMSPKLLYIKIDCCSILRHSNEHIIS